MSWCVALAALAASACGTAGGPHTVLTLAGGFRQSATVRTGVIINVGVAPLHNFSDHGVKIRSVELVAQPAGLHDVAFTAYLYRQAGPEPGIVGGNLEACLPDMYIPHPVASVTVPAHSDSSWMIVLSFRIPQPGT
jgi:hypothetical protein